MAGEPIGVIGVGYVGLVTAACFADLGNRVICRDIDPVKVGRLCDGEVPMHEPGLEELLRRNRHRLTFTLDLDELFAEARLAFVCVDTPPLPSGDADLSRVQAVVAAIPASAEGAALVMKSTVPVGTGRKVRHDLDARGLEGVAYLSNPEFLREGAAVPDFMAPDRIVIGADTAADADRVARLYDGIDAEIVRTDVASAEMIKLAANAFLATKISFINEIANVCESVGADVAEVARGMGLDRRIGASFLRPGLGFGGSCFPKDVQALKQLAGNSGYHFQLLTSVIEVNELQKRRVISKLQAHLGTLRGRRIALLGIAFKPNTDDVREASSLVLSSRLVAEGADVRAYDPVASGEAVAGVGARVCSSAVEALEGADAAVIVTEWNEFRAVLDPQVRDLMARPLLIDGRNLLDPDEAARAGFEYDSIGRPARARHDVIAVVLVGGQGTRLRPLTDDRPKPMLPIAGRPFLAHMLDRIAAAGVERVIFSCGYLPAPIVEEFGDSYAGMQLAYAVEPEPMDTAGAIRFAAEGAVDGPFLALNGDILAESSLADLQAFHRAHAARATLTLTEVSDPTRYGLVLTDADANVTAFVEKPTEPGPPPYYINAGAYVLDPSVLDLIPAGRRVNIEREVFPQLVGNGLVGFRSSGYWNDIGTPESYLAANLHLIGEQALIADDAEVDADATVIRSVVGQGARVARGARIEEAVLHERAVVEAGAVVRRAVIGRDGRVAAGEVVDGA